MNTNEKQKADAAKEEMRKHFDSLFDHEGPKIVKRRPGRPALRAEQKKNYLAVTVRLAQSDVDVLDNLAFLYNMDRSAALRKIIRQHDAQK